MEGSTDNHTIAENTAANTNLGTLSATDADTGDTFTYTLVNNSEAYFSINGNTLKLAKTVDYEVAESVTKLVLTVVFSAMLRLPVEVISEGVSSLTSVMWIHLPTP
jgi:hypothetical protein